MIKINDQVRIKNYGIKQTGTVVKIFDENATILKNGERIDLTEKWQYKIKFEVSGIIHYSTFDLSLLEKI